MSSHAHPITLPRSRFMRLQPSTMIRAAGWLVLVGALGAAFAEWTLWALLPAAALLGYALVRSSFSSNRAGRIAGRFTAAFLGAAIALTLVGSVIVGRSGYEPRWMIWASLIAAAGLVLGLVAVGFVVARRGARMTGMLLGVALPLGIGLDWFTTTMFPAGLFVVGFGFYVGMLLLAGGLLRLGNGERE